MTVVPMVLVREGEDFKCKQVREGRDEACQVRARNVTRCSAGLGSGAVRADSGMYLDRRVGDELKLPEFPGGELRDFPRLHRLEGPDPHSGPPSRGGPAASLLAGWQGFSRPGASEEGPPSPSCTAMPFGGTGEPRPPLPTWTHLVPQVGVRQLPVIGLLAQLPKLAIGEPRALRGRLHYKAGQEADAALPVDERKALEVSGAEGAGDLRGTTGPAQESPWRDPGPLASPQDGSSARPLTTSR